MSLFEGTPTTAPSSSTSTTTTPQWYQDLNYNQMMAAKAVADMPYQQYGMPRVAEMTPDQLAANQAVRQNVGAWEPYFQTSLSGVQNLQSPTAAYGQGMNYLNRAGQTDITGAAQPYMAAAGQSSASGIGQYMNPYNDAVTSQIARLGARNLSENLLPQVSDAFIRSGSFGGSRMGEFGARALRDTQEAVLSEQAKALQSGYGQALGASQQDLARQAQLASTAGTLANQQGALMSNVGQTTAGLGQTEAERQLGTLQSYADLARTGQGMYAQDAAAMSAVGQDVQAQKQKQLDAAYQNYMDQLQHPQRQLDWYQAQLKGAGQYLPTTTSQSGYTTTPGVSPLMQLASGYFALKGLGSAASGN